jgi:hypothetical protein
MLDVTLSILALIAGGVTLEAFTTARATLSGWNEDQHQLAYGPLGRTEDPQAGNPS